MEIKICHPVYRAYLRKLQTKASDLGDAPANCRSYSSELEALDELADLYDELNGMLGDYEALLKKEYHRLTKVSASLQAGDAASADSFK